MKNIFTKQFRHFFLILFAVLLILQLLGSGTFIITKTKQLLFTVFITSCLTSIFSYSRIYFYNYLLALLPLLSLLFCKTAAGEVITSVNIAYYSIFSLSFTNIIFFCIITVPHIKLYDFFLQQYCYSKSVRFFFQQQFGVIILPAKVSPLP